MQQILPMQAQRRAAGSERSDQGSVDSRRQAQHTPAVSPVSRWRSSLHHLGIPLVLVWLLIGWQALVSIKGYKDFVLPAPSVVAERFVAAASSGILWEHVFATLLQAMSGFLLALVVSVVLGYVLAHIPWLERIVAPVLAASQAVPIIAVAPLIVLWFGTGLQSKILVAALITFFPMLLTTIVALRSVPRDLKEMAVISGASRWQMLRFVEAPLALPVFFGGVRAGLSLATTGAVVAEFVAGREGLGSLITIARGLFDTPLIFVALFLLAGITLSLYLLVTLIERLLIRWEV